MNNKLSLKFNKLINLQIKNYKIFNKMNKVYKLAKVFTIIKLTD